MQHCLILFGLCLGIELSREAREVWPLLTVETEVNGDSKRTKDRGSSLVGFRLVCRYNKFLYRLGCSSQLSKIFVYRRLSLCLWNYSLKLHSMFLIKENTVGRLPVK